MLQTVGRKKGIEGKSFQHAVGFGGSSIEAMGLLGPDPGCRLGPAPLSPAIVVLLHVPGNYPTLGSKDVDGGGDAVEDGTHLRVPGTPNVLAVPGAAPASPRYGSAQVRSPAPGGVTPPTALVQENVRNQMERPLSGRFGQRARVISLAFT